MKKIAILIIFFLLGSYLAGCATRYGLYDPKEKQALRTLAGGALGALVAWNVGGAIVGAFVVDIANLTIIKYEDKQLEDREEAARRLKDKYKAEEKKEDKKAEDKKEEDKKAETKKEEDKKKLGEKEEEKRKIGEKEEENKRAEKKRREERVQLYIEGSAILTKNVKPGSIAEANVQYILLAPVDVQQIKITETRILYTPTKSLELDKRHIVRKQGTHLSTIKFTVPEDTPKGLCILYTTVSDGKYAKTAKSVLVII
jgi:flagellar biosynthesis GTPase FlhF